jgi:YVTN family beta-propeller protein
VANEYGNALTVLNLATGNTLSTVTGFAGPNALAVTPNGKQIYVTNASSSTVWAINAATLAIEAKIPTGLMPTSVVVSADGTTVYVTNGYGFSITEISTATNTVIETMAKVGVYPFSIALFQ